MNCVTLKFLDSLLLWALEGNCCLSTDWELSYKWTSLFLVVTLMWRRSSKGGCRPQLLLTLNLTILTEPVIWWNNGFGLFQSDPGFCEPSYGLCGLGLISSRALIIFPMDLWIIFNPIVGWLIWILVSGFLDLDFEFEFGKGILFEF